MLLLEEGESQKKHFRHRKNRPFLFPAPSFPPPTESFRAALLSQGWEVVFCLSVTQRTRQVGLSMHLRYLVLMAFLGHLLGKSWLFVNAYFFFCGNSCQPFQVHMGKSFSVTGKCWEMSPHMRGFALVLSRRSYCWKGERRDTSDPFSISSLPL